jgi:aldose 1-epimerase
MIGERTIAGSSALTLSSDAAGGMEAAFVPSAGMVGCSLRHRGEELLGQRGGLRTYIEEHSTMGIPLLHPWANRLALSRFPVAGSVVELALDSPPPALDANGLPIHGLLAAVSGWSMEAHKGTDDGGVLLARFDFASHNELLDAFPFPHQVLLDASLQATELRITTTILASDDGAVPISFGYHTYLRLPGIARADWEVEMPVRVRLELDRRMLPTGRRDPVRVEGGRLGSRTFDDAYLAPEEGAPFVLAGGGRRIELRLGTGYRFAQVYAPPDDDVIAYEAMTAPTNALVAGGPDLPLLEPGGRFEAEFSIRLADHER